MSLRPESEAELSEMIRGAQAPLSIRGGATRGLAPAGAALETSGLSGVTLYEPGAMTLVVGAGTPLSEVEALLAGENQILPFEPPRFGAGTIGGVFATGLSGPRRVTTGSARDAALGVRFVDGQGRALSNGGRVMKNVTGVDLTRLMVGAHGTLGVLTELSFKTMTRPEQCTTLHLRAAPEPALEALIRAQASPFWVSGAVADADGARLRVEGFAPSVRERMDGLTQLLGDLGEISEEAADWTVIRDLSDAPAGQSLWRLSLRPREAGRLLARLAPSWWRLDWAGARLWATCAPERDLRADLAAAARDEGFDPRHHSAHLERPGSGATQPRFAPRAPGVAALDAGLRAQYDPRGVLNPGLMEG